jgi:hypothetical protein
MSHRYPTNNVSGETKPVRTSEIYRDKTQKHITLNKSTLNPASEQDQQRLDQHELAVKDNSYDSIEQLLTVTQEPAPKQFTEPESTSSESVVLKYLFTRTLLPVAISTKQAVSQNKDQ